MSRYRDPREGSRLLRCGSVGGRAGSSLTTGRTHAIKPRARGRVLLRRLESEAAGESFEVHTARWLTEAGAPRSNQERGAPAFAVQRGQRVRFAACSMTLVTALGSAIIERWGASILVIWAPALWAIESWSASGMTWSAVPTTSQDGMVAQAGGPEGSVRALVASGRCVAASFRPFAGGEAVGEAAREHALLDVGVDYDRRGGAGERNEVEHVVEVLHGEARSGAGERLSVSPWAGTNASTYTSALTWLSPYAALVITAPP